MPVEALTVDTCPVLTLPTEIVSEIFTQFLPAYPLCPPLVGLASPTLVTRICRQWREIALGTPALWRAIDLSDDKLSTRTQADIGILWLDRSRSCPLSLKIGTEDRDRAISPVIEAVVPHLVRWEHLSIAVGSLRAGLPPLGPMPLLRSLLVTVQDLRFPMNTAVSWLDAPLLRSATLDDVTAEIILLAWSQLTSLTLQRVVPSECTPVLQQTTRLVRCSLSLVSDDADADAPPQLALPHLESLTMLELDEDFPVTGYLETFLVPSLSNLEVPETFLGEDPIRCLESFIEKAGCKLRDVVITGDDIVLVDSYRSAFPSIAQFSFRRHHPDEGYIDYFHR
ncbi:hypothetical protein C8R46DRAFT_1118748 [Mycena filopes]|nr:hypothetical protein C8R46DRAFT_1118748 [Mycena filopes]